MAAVKDTSYLCVLVAIISAVALCSGADEQRLVKRSTQLTISTLVEPPYVIQKAGTSATEGNDNFEGLVPDMLKEIFKKMPGGLTYNLKVVHDHKYGTKEGNRWTGMIGEVFEHRAQMAAGPITVSDQRRVDVDFTESFMTFNVAVLLKRPAADAKVIKNVKELAEQTDMKYVVMKDGHTRQLLRNPENPDVKKISNYLEEFESQTVGVKKVQDSHGKYAMIIESVTADYYVGHNCDLIKIDIPEISPSQREYAFALQKNSQYTHDMNNTIKALKASGDFDTLKAKWWKNTCGAAGLNAGPAAGVKVAVSLLLAAAVAAVQF